MIQKKIHYCWFGRGKMPELALRCIESWKKYCPDYELIRWDEDNFDVNSVPYVKEAYECKKYAFVTDYVRLYAMVNFGGVYMDTDVELIAPIDRFLVHRAFSGFEEKDSIPTGIMACEKGFPLFDKFMHYYDDAHFIAPDGSMNMTTNTKTMTGIVEGLGLCKNGEFQVIEGFTLYPKEVFCPLDNSTGKLCKTKDTVAIHWFSKSWIPKSQRNRLKITRVFHRIFGNNCFDWLKKLLRK